ncbi:hypothetical protein D1007_05638 [Hordeum vulgare]|nr:hypothetical protein D1007_05638 [Hordeum vulgare]
MPLEGCPLVDRAPTGENNEHDDDENDDIVLHDNSLGDLDKYNLQETMDHSITYSRGYASKSDDEGPDEEVDEEGFTTKEAEAFTKATQSCSFKHEAALHGFMCRGKRIDGKLSSQNHRQLTSEFIAYRLSKSISSLPTMSIKSAQDLVKSLFHYKLKYGKAWKAKQSAFKMLYGDWEQAYNQLPRLLGAIVATNPGMVHVVEPYGEITRIHNGKTVHVFGRAFWAFEQRVRAFQHRRPVISIDGTFSTGKFKGTLLVAIGSDVNNRLMPFAFALVESENNVNWELFLHILGTKVLPSEREIYVISDRHQGILNAVDIVLPGHAPVHHRWCMRHFCANFYRACDSKDLTDDLQDCCQAFSDKRFARLYNALVANKKLDAGMVASQPNKATTEWGEEKDAVGEDQGLWERAAKKLREEDATKAKEEEYDARMKEELKITIDH